MNTIIQRLSFLQTVVVAPSLVRGWTKELVDPQFPWCSSVDDMTSTLLMSCCNPDWIPLCLVDLLQYFLKSNLFNIEVDRRYMFMYCFQFSFFFCSGPSVAWGSISSTPFILFWKFNIFMTPSYLWIIHFPKLLD